MVDGGEEPNRRRFLKSLDVDLPPPPPPSPQVAEDDDDAAAANSAHTIPDQNEALYAVVPRPNGQGLDIQPIGVLNGRGQIAHFSPGWDAKRYQDFAQHFPGRVVSGGKDFNSGIKQYDYARVMGDKSSGNEALRNAMIAMDEHLGGTNKDGIYASVNEGKAYVRQDGHIYEFHFVSGAGQGANDPRAENVANRGPTPANLPGTHYTMRRQEEDYKGRGGAGYMISEAGSITLHNGRAACMFHPLGSTGFTAGCFGINPAEVQQFDALLGRGQHDVVVANTGLAQEAAARHDNQQSVAKTASATTAKPSVRAGPAPTSM